DDLPVGLDGQSVRRRKVLTRPKRNDPLPVLAKGRIQTTVRGQPDHQELFVLFRKGSLPSDDDHAIALDGDSIGMVVESKDVKNETAVSTEGVVKSPIISVTSSHDV